MSPHGGATGVGDVFKISAGVGDGVGGVIWKNGNPGFDYWKNTNNKNNNKIQLLSKICCLK
jgi:hypothetical protein